MIENIWSISQLVTYIKGKLRADFNLQKIRLQGELGNFSDYKGSGHWYFTLKDEYASIKCAMFRGYNNLVEFSPKNGDMVIVTGTVNIFDARGELQIVVTEMSPAGQGNFYIQFEKTRKKLEPLGYFAEERKKPIPAYPSQISVVTGANTAALQDIRITINNRWPNIVLREEYAIVQGKEAIDSIVNALQRADTHGSDVIILARGGGSVDDLWCFNDEKIAEAIFRCKTPVITGIGHEIDTTIADLVADARAATPTAAAQRATPDRNEVIKKINSCLSDMKYNITAKLQNYYQVNDHNHTVLDNYADRGLEYLRTIESYRHIMGLSLSRNIDLNEERYKSLLERIDRNAHLFYNNSAYRYRRVIDILENVNPLKVLKRGYSLTRQDGRVIKSINDVDMNSEMTVTYQDGNLKVKPLEKEETV